MTPFLIFESISHNTISFSNFCVDNYSDLIFLSQKDKICGYENTIRNNSGRMGWRAEICF